MYTMTTSGKNKTRQKPVSIMSARKTKNKISNADKTTRPSKINKSMSKIDKTEINQLIMYSDAKTVINKFKKYHTDNENNYETLHNEQNLSKRGRYFQNEQPPKNSGLKKMAKHITPNTAIKVFKDVSGFIRSVNKLMMKKINKNVAFKPKLVMSNATKNVKPNYTSLIDKNTQGTKIGVEILPSTKNSNGVHTIKRPPRPVQNGSSKFEKTKRIPLKLKQNICNVHFDRKESTHTIKPQNKQSIMQEKLHLLINEFILNHSHYKRLANEAVNRNEIFTIVGNSNFIKNALEKRGWIQKLTDIQDRFLKNSLIESSSNVESNFQTVIVSHLLKRIQPNLVWIVKNTDKCSDYSNYMKSPMINRLKMEDKYFTTKGGLCSSLQNKYWFYIEGISEVNAPRSYNIFTKDELDTFITDYRLTACTSLLKWFVRRQRNTEIKLISKDGNISLSTILFALKRCKTYIYDKQHRYMDYNTLHKIPKNNEWDEFIENYNKLINNEDHFTIEDKSVLNYYMELSYTILHEMYKYRPQLECEGLFNVWIIKPTQRSRGKGILLKNHLQDIILSTAKAEVNKYVVQKYIEMPLLIYETKFDIRQYFIISNTHPLTIWMYKNCYLRFCTQNYRLDDFHESIHLTNNAVQRKYKNCIERHPNLPTNNMWSLAEFRSYLTNAGNPMVWDNIVYPEMKRNIVGAMLSCQDGMRQCKDRFELYGCDFVLDNEYKPWLIEINSGPDMSPSTDVTAKICPETLEDLIKVILDHRKNNKSPTGNFECIYRQKMINGKETSDVSTMMACGVKLGKKYFCKLENVYEPQYDTAGVIQHADIHLPLKHDKGILRSDSKTLTEAPSIGDTMVSHYNQTSSLCLTEDIEEPQSVDVEKICHISTTHLLNSCHSSMISQSS